VILLHFVVMNYLVLSIISSLFIFFAQVVNGAIPIQLSLGVHHLVDTALLESTNNTYFSLGTPIKNPIPLLIPENPWEAALHFYTSLVFLSAANSNTGAAQWLIYYGCSDGDLFITPIGVCVANSSDGVLWHKPMLPYHPYILPGSATAVPTNIVFITEANCFGLQAFVDARTNGAHGVQLLYESSAHRLLYATRSNDGFLFSPSNASNASDTAPALPFATLADTDASIAYSAALDTYTVYGRADGPHPDSTRGCAGANDVFRSVAASQKICNQGAVCNATDPTGWTLPRIILAPGSPDALDCLDNYNAAAFQVPDSGTGSLFIMLPSAIRHIALNQSGAPDTRAGSNDGFMDVRLASSRDGMNFSFSSRDTFLPRGIGARDPASGLYNATGSEKDAGFVFATSGGVLDTDVALLTPPLTPSVTVSLLYWGSQTTHAGGGAYLYRYWPGAFTGIFRAQLRREGYVSLSTLPHDPTGSGTAITVPLLLPPTSSAPLYLRLNADISVAGTVTLAFLDAATRVSIPGFGVGDCSKLNGNGVRQLIECAGGGTNGDISQLAARADAIVIQFTLVHAKVYAWEFSS
jgi:hypothetical protein